MSTDAAKITHVDRSAAITHAIQNQPDNQLVMSVTATATPKVVGTARAKPQFSVTATATPSVEAIARAFASLSTTATATPNIVDATGRTFVSGSVGVSATPNVVGVSTLATPLLRNLQFFADYENWTAGDPLPNRYPDNSGIQDLTDENTVQEDTSTPIVGSKSGLYNGNNNQKHSSTNQNFGLDINDICFTVFARMENSENNPIVSISNSDTQNGIDIFYSRLNNNIAFATENSTGRDRITLSWNGDKAMIQGWYTHANGEGHILLNDNASKDSALSAPRETSLPITVADLADGGYNKNIITIDMVAVEVAPQGKLQWPSESTWLYNGGAGRSWDEIKTYQP